MGRRKIEIKAIKDDRNRSVTFLKRKGGLFKKAHELSVLCSVDVAVIIFGNNKKLYEYSSGDVGEILTRYQYYGPPNEHKGPPDFNGKKDMDDDDDDDASVASGPGSDHPQMMPPQFQNQPAFQHIRNHTPSASPPIPNGVPFHHQQQPPRGHTPQPPQVGSRPSSRNARRPSSNMMPQHGMPQPPHPQPNGYAYMPNPAIYNPHGGQTMPPHGHGMPPHMQGPPMQAQQMHGPPSGVPQPSPGPQYPQYATPTPPAQQQQPPQQPQPVQQVYMEDQRRTSMPPSFPPQERPASRPQASPPLPQQQQQQASEPEQQQQQQQPSQMPEPIKRLSVKSRSIFTPIDESRSILSQHWASSTATSTSAGSTGTENANRSQSVDVSSAARTKPSPPVSHANIKTRNVSMSSMSSAPLISPSDGFTPPSRTNSANLAGGKRPVLKVQIPEEQSDDGTGDSNSSPQGPDAHNANAARRNGEHGSSVVLPPPSPSASALLSAGASGPPNPFARPHPVPQNTTTNNSNNSNTLTLNTSRAEARDNLNIDTPVSALPSRFTNEFLPSPSSFYPEWNYRSGDGNTLLSPLNFATPVVGSGPSFLREDSATAPTGGNGNGKRKSPDVDGDDGADMKRQRHD
ncbi:MADS-box MEF2 type transcription factor [Xylogone sp. PMI_703]|nr:MADS-box MEF2 type transcription factor [Xylogone sp. PMI_703]